MQDTRLERCDGARCLEKDAAFYAVERSVRFSFPQTFFYFISYNRYAFLIAIISIVIVITSFLFGRWYVWLPATLIALRALYWAWHIARQFPKKLHITKKIVFAQRQGTFAPQDVVKYCADPCYRVVARQALAFAGIGRRERDALVREYTRRAHDLAHAFVIVDSDKGRVLTFIDGVLTEKPLENQPGGIQ